MEKIKQNDLLNIQGGVTLSSSLLNSFTNIIEILLEVGRSLGSSLRRIGSNEACSIE